MAHFVADVRQWETLDDFCKHLSAHNPAVCGWVQRIVLHHTAIPTATQWRGLASMRNIRTYYDTKLGWSCGPHLFISGDAINPLDRGIFQLTPLNHQCDTHSNNCNGNSIAIEVVGNYDRECWRPATTALVTGAAAAFLRWRGLPIAPATVAGHRQCGSKKTCPGTKIDLTLVRQQIITAGASLTHV